MRKELDLEVSIVAGPDGPLALLRQKLALEPSIAGSKLIQQE